MELFKRTVRNDSENYELLYDLVARYTDVPEITQEQIGILNDFHADCGCSLCWKNCSNHLNMCRTPGL